LSAGDSQHGQGNCICLALLAVGGGEVQRGEVVKPALAVLVGEPAKLGGARGVQGAVLGEGGGGHGDYSAAIC